MGDWNERVGEDFKTAKGCLDNLYSEAKRGDRDYEERRRDYDQVRAILDAWRTRLHNDGDSSGEESGE